MSPAPPSKAPDLRDARAARLAAQHAGGGNKRRKLEEDEDDDVGKRVAMRRPASSQNLFDTGDLGAPWRDPAPSLALTRKASQHNLTRAASAANVMGLEEPLLQTVARDLARQNSRQDVLKRPASTNNLALPDRVTVRKRAPPGTPSHRSPPSHPPPTNNKGKAPPGLPLVLHQATSSTFPEEVHRQSARRRPHPKLIGQRHRRSRRARTPSSILESLPSEARAARLHRGKADRLQKRKPHWS